MKKYTVVYTPASVEQIKEIAKWYNSVNKGLGKKIKHNLKIALDNIKLNPFAHAVRYGHVRFAVPEKFPYAAHYTVDSDKLIVTVHAVFGFKENPDKWKRYL